jgi:hypothetical protein
MVRLRLITASAAARRYRTVLKLVNNYEETQKLLAAK